MVVGTRAAPRPSTAFRAVTILLALGVGDASAQQPAEYTVGVLYANSLMSNTDRFEFSVGAGSRIVIDFEHRNVNFPTKFASGQRYAVAQLSGPRACTLSEERTGTIADRDVAVVADCGLPPVSMFKLDVLGVEPGETFGFADGYGRSLSAPFAATLNLGTFPIGDNYRVRQTAGPRPCRMTSAEGIVPSAALTLQADCRRPSAQLRLGVAHAHSLVSNKERFEFAIGNADRVVIDHRNPSAYFAARFGTDESYQVSQISGPRACNFLGGQAGTFANEDVLVYADCGTPPLSIFSLEIAGVGPSESFGFADDHGRRLTVPFPTPAPVTVNLGGFPIGDDYSVVQTTGPRPCRMTHNQGVVPQARLTIKADCGPGNAGGQSGGADSGGGSPVGGSGWDLVSRSTDDKTIGSYYESQSPAIGGSGPDEGRYVAFVSYARLAGSSGSYRQIMWRDRLTGTTRMISVSALGEEGNQNSFAPAISADGRSVAFESYASNLVPGDTNGVRDVFVWRAESGAVERASTGAGGGEANGESYEPAISGNGGLVAFTSTASNLVPVARKMSSNDVYLKNTQGGAIGIVSLNEKTNEPGGGSNPSISADGSRIAFYSYPPLTAEDANNLWDIYVWSRASGALKRVTRTAAGGDKNQGDDSASRVVAPTISGDGRFVTYATTATDIVPGDNNGAQDVFLVDVDGGSVRRLSVDADGREGSGDSPAGQGERIGISHDGAWVAFSTKATNLGGRVVQRSTTSPITFGMLANAGSAAAPAISPGGQFIVVGTSEPVDARFGSSGLFVTMPSALSPSASRAGPGTASP